MLLFFFRYQIIFKNIREKYDLEIRLTEDGLKEIFGNNLYTVDVKKKYLCFTLKSIEFNYTTLHKKLMVMGKMVKKNFFNQFDKKEDDLYNIKTKDFFLQKIPNVFYGYAESCCYEQDNDAEEAIDGLTIKKSNKLYVSYDLVNSNDIPKTNNEEINAVMIGQLLIGVQSYHLYLNIFDQKVTCDGKTKRTKEIIDTEHSVGDDAEPSFESILYDWFKITIKDPLCQSETDSGNIIFLEYKSENGKYVDLINEGEPTTYAAIESIDDIEPESEVSKNISNIYSISPYSFNKEKITKKFNEIIDSIKYLIIYNTGQALCTALADVALNPLLFFDFGIPNPFNRFTLHNKNYLENLHLKQECLVVLSHWDSDHYLLAKEHAQASTLFWLEPEIAVNGSNPKNIHGTASNTLTKIRNELIKKNNIASWPENTPSLQFSYGKILKANGDYSHRHNYGLSLQMNINDKKILIMGDNRYDLLDCSELYEAYDILVVSHHGGISLHSKKNVQFIPRSVNNLGIGIYSYGIGSNGKVNKHRHPSSKYVGFHVNSGWLSEIHTTGNIINSVPSNININNNFIAIPL